MNPTKFCVSHQTPNDMLTNIDHIKTIRDISANVKSDRIVPYIKEVEDAYIMPAIGVKLYRELDEQTNTDPVLLDGGYYTNARGVDDYCHGIRRAVAYFAYARVLKNNQINVTSFGVVGKTGTYSQPTDESNVDDAVIQARKMGDLYLESVKRYIARETCGCAPKTPGVGGAKLHIQILN